MSKERDLLVSCLDEFQYHEVPCSDLIRAIQWLLNEPEQTEQAPVGSVKTIGGYPDQSEHTVELTCRHGDLKDGDLLYKAPQKREPIEDEELEVWYSQHALAMDKQEYMWGFRDAEKAHGITGVDNAI